MAYLKAIGETDSLVIDEFLSECATSPDILHYTLQLAEDTLRIHHGDNRSGGNSETAPAHSPPI